ncbi:MAG: hypothetical protein JWM74_1696, partial [Myxococcaceae bacterium]|nr:hypothetical protein [Myxococcaceae bacterium]
ADFDGDGVSDILTWKTPPHPFEGSTAAAPAPARLSVHFGEANGDIKEDYQLHISNAPNLLGLHPTVGHLTSDATRSDVVVSVRGGTSIFQGQADRTLLPVLNPSIAVPNIGLRPLVLDATSSSPGDEILLFTMTDPVMGPDFGSIVPLTAKTGDLDPGQRIAVVPTGPGKKVASIYSGRFHTSGGPSCDEVAIAFEGDSRIAIVTPCNGEGLNTCLIKKGDPTCNLPVPVRFVDLPNGQTVTPDGMTFGDYNGDGHIDFVVATGERISEGKYLEPGPCIAFGTPDQKFKAVFDALPARCLRLSPSDFLPVARGAKSGDPALLAFGQLTSDVAVDFVTERSIVLRSADVPKDGGADAGPQTPTIGGTTTLVLAPPGVEWREAHIVDINGDGLNDVVAGGPNGVDVYVATGERLLVHKAYPTAGGADLFTFSDFDGDATADIAFRQPGAARGNARDLDTISISFGHRNALPENPLPLGRLSSVEQIVSGRTGEGLFGIAADGLGDIGIVSRTADFQQLTLLSGEVDRRVVSSFQLAPNAALAPLASRFAIGRFSQDPALGDPHNDIAILTGAYHADDTPTVRRLVGDYALWLAPVLAEASLDQARLFGDAPKLGTIASSNGANEGDAFWPFASTLALDLDPRGSDPKTEVDEVFVLAQGFGAAPWKLRTFTSSGGAKPAFTERDSRDVGVAPTQPTDAFRMLAVDLDPTGDPAKDAEDVVLLLREADKTTLRVYFNRRTGKLDPTPVEIVLPAGHDFVDVAAIHAGETAAHALALLAKDGVYMAHVTATGIQVEPARVVTADGARRIAAGDVSGDRIDDIVLVSDKGIQVFRGEPRLK